MIREGMTIREAAQEWVGEMNAIPQAMIQKLMAADPCDWTEVTTPCKNDRVYYYEDSEYGEIVCINDEDDDIVYLIELENGKTVEAQDDDFEVIRYDELPMWGTMWSFGDGADDWWLENCKYSFSDLVENCKFAFGNDLNVNNLVRIMFEMGIDEIEESIIDRIGEYDPEDASDDEKEEHESLLLLNPREDIESFHNYIDTHIWVTEHRELYKRYLQAELDHFCDMTGFEISTD